MLETERKSAFFPLEQAESFKKRLLAWVARSNDGLFLDSNGRPEAEWDCLAGSGARTCLRADAGTAFEKLKNFRRQNPDWMFGFLAYDLKNEVEKLQSARFDGIGFPDLYFFQPEIVVGLRKGQLEIHSAGPDPQTVLNAILDTPEILPRIPDGPVLPMHARMPKADYLATVDTIRRHILEGDLYEMNLCQEFYAEELQLDPPAVFAALNDVSRAPFSAFLRTGGRYLLCASPERFLQKKGEILRSQPIKGTRKRGADPESDEQIRRELAASEKDRAENVMIVDLVRNDLAKFCRPGSVQVESLFGIHSFETVHQMISTVRGALRPDADPLDALRGAFPMGSMTGAPKVMAMELIERCERSRRGLYSGALGYFTPQGDFDFNVVIRSILYNAETQYCAVQVGGAIVYDSVAEQEYEECMVKAQAMLKVLNGRL